MKWVGRLIRIPFGIIMLLAMFVFTIIWAALLWNDKQWWIEIKNHFVWVWTGEVED